MFFPQFGIDFTHQLCNSITELYNDKKKSLAQLYQLKKDYRCKGKSYVKSAVCFCL